MLNNVSPCTPEESGICKEVIKQLGAVIPILGVCLGHQAIGAAFGSKVIRSCQPTHGRSSQITHYNYKLFSKLPETFTVGRYHSLIIDPQTLSKELTITSIVNTGEIMSIEHKVYPVVGVQFHPESIMTEHGLTLLSNFINYYTVGNQCLKSIGNQVVG